MYIYTCLLNLKSSAIQHPYNSKISGNKTRKFGVKLCYVDSKITRIANKITRFTQQIDRQYWRNRVRLIKTRKKKKRVDIEMISMPRANVQCSQKPSRKRTCQSLWIHEYIQMYILCKFRERERVVYRRFEGEIRRCDVGMMTASQIPWWRRERGLYFNYFFKKKRISHFVLYYYFVT